MNQGQLQEKVLGSSLSQIGVSVRTTSMLDNKLNITCVRDLLETNIKDIVKIKQMSLKTFLELFYELESYEIGRASCRERV